MAKKLLTKQKLIVFATETVVHKYYSKCPERHATLLTLKRLGREGEGWGVNLTCGFSKNNASSKERRKPWFFVTLNIIIRHIFPANSIEIPQVVQKI